MSIQQELFSVKEVASMLGTSRRTVWKLRRVGVLPEPVRLSKRLVRWRRADIDDYLARRRPA
jgi:prophage regulatory protein